MIERRRMFRSIIADSETRILGFWSLSTSSCLKKGTSSQEGLSGYIQESHALSDDGNPD